MTALTEQLKAAIAARGETLYAVAKRAGVSYPVVHRFMNGKRGIGLDTAARLARSLDLKLADETPRKGRGTRAQLDGLLRRAFDGAIDRMVAGVLEVREPTADELDKLEALVAAARRRAEP